MSRLSQSFQQMELSLFKMRPWNHKWRSSFHFENNRFKKTFTNSKEIGRGSYGIVYKARHKLENWVYAIKKIKLQLGNETDPRDHKLFREVEMMSQCTHHNIVKFITCWFEEDSEKENVLKIEREMSSFQITFSQ